jgi:hypothetical protein
VKRGEGEEECEVNKTAEGRVVGGGGNAVAEEGVEERRRGVV